MPKSIESVTEPCNFLKDLVSSTLNYNTCARVKPLPGLGWYSTGAADARAGASAAVWWVSQYISIQCADASQSCIAQVR